MSIRSEIETRLAAVAATLNLPVAYENVAFTKPTNSGYLEIIFLSSTTINRNITASNTRIRGVFQINCYGPLNVGLGDLDSTVDTVIAAFPTFPQFGTVRIDEPLSDGQAVIVDNFIMIPITGKYRVET